MSVIHAPRKPGLDLRTALFPVLLVVCLLVLFLRLWYIQVVKAPELQERARASHLVSVSRLAPRGLIFDRNGVLIAGVRPEIVVTAKPGIVRKEPAVLEELASLLKADPARLRRKVDDASFRPYLASPIFVGADIATGTQIAEAGEDLPGVGVETQPMRRYLDPFSFSHVLGYVGLPNERDIRRIQEAGLTPAEYVGKSGIERAYESELMGKAGVERLAVDAKRRPLRIAGRDAAIPGNQLVLTIDASLQRFATELLAERGHLGGVVALDPRTGEILCLVSSPTFDQNLFNGGISEADWRKLAEDPRKPLWNRAIYSNYAPGSTFKIVTTLAALQAGKFDPNMTFYCGGGVSVGRQMFRCLGRHGSISFHRAMAKSCNSYFYQLGRLIGEDALRHASISVGLGQRTGLEILGEAEGIVPTDAWIKRHKADGRWYVGDTLNFSIGQGFLSTTPIQMANVAALVANDGVHYRPHLVRAIKDPITGSIVRRIYPEVLHRVQAPPEFWQRMRSALVDVIEAGTAGSARIQGLRWGGKTGSAEHRRDQLTHGWFVGFAPAENPRIAICVLIEAAGHGGDVAAPIAKEIVARYLETNSAAAASNASASRSASAALSASPIDR